MGFYKDDRSSSYGGGNSGGGWKGKKSFGDRGGEGVELHEAVCSECGIKCEVPFKPNGKKPVFCRACFKKDVIEKPRYEKPYEKPFEKSYEKPQADNHKAQFEMLNFKLDMILKALHQKEEKPVQAVVPSPDVGVPNTGL